MEWLHSTNGHFFNDAILTIKTRHRVLQGTLNTKGTIQMIRQILTMHLNFAIQKICFSERSLRMGANAANLTMGDLARCQRRHNAIRKP